MLKQIDYWVKQYGSAGVSDTRAVQDFLTCETDESIKTLRNELTGLSQDKSRYKEETLDKIIGVKRKVLYKSYTEWAKLMLLWISSNYRGS